MGKVNGWLILWRRVGMPVCARFRRTVRSWDKSAPRIVVTGISTWAWYNHPVTPAFTLEDQNLEPDSVLATLDGQVFASGTEVAAEGKHVLVVAGGDGEGHVSSGTWKFTIDRTSPAIAFTGVSPGQLKVGQAAVGVTITELNPGASSFVLNNLTLGTTAAYQPGSPITRDGAYRLDASAQDLALNLTTASLSFTLDAPPPAPLGLQVVLEGGGARLSWTKPEPDVKGYRVYRNGVLRSESYFTGTSFAEQGIFPDAGLVYEVSAVDNRGQEGPKARAAVPALSVDMAPPPLTRGFQDLLGVVVTNKSTFTFTAGPATVELVKRKTHEED